MLPNEIIFSSNQLYQRYKSDTDFWQPIIDTVLLQHNCNQKTISIKAGFNSTYPVFIIDDKVIKFFGHRTNWLEAYNHELLAYQCLAQDPKLRVPQIIAQGQLYEHTTAPWPYVILTRIKGTSWLDSDLSYDQKQSIIAELGRQIQRIHALPITMGLKDHLDCEKHDLKAAAKHSSLPQHLIDQIDRFMLKLHPFDTVFVNGDMVSMHVFVNEGEFSGIIDWGDATVTDRHYEIGKLCLSLFPCDKVLLRILLESSDWPLTSNFPLQSLGMALYRQAIGLTQHSSFDIFYQLPIDLEKSKTLEELADVLFQI